MFQVWTPANEAVNILALNASCVVFDSRLREGSQFLCWASIVMPIGALHELRSNGLQSRGSSCTYHVASSVNENCLARQNFYGLAGLTL